MLQNQLITALVPVLYLRPNNDPQDDINVRTPHHVPEVDWGSVLQDSASINMGQMRAIEQGLHDASKHGLLDLEITKLNDPQPKIARESGQSPFQGLAVDNDLKIVENQQNKPR